MSSFASSQRHLDAAAGREVVYCHACENEWYQDDEEGLECPRCHSGATEIVSPDNDPRNIHDAPSIQDFGGAGPRFFPSGHDTDSDPDEADIEEHVTHAPHGVFMRRRVFRPSAAGGGPEDGTTPRPDRGGRVDPSDGDAILHRFTDMLMNDFQVGAAGRSGPDALFPGQHQQQQQQQQPPYPEVTPNFFLGAPPRFQRTTIIGSGPHGGRTSFTISTGTFQPTRAGNPGEVPDFNTVFGNLMNSIPPPNPNDPNDPNRAGGVGGPGGGPQQRGNVFAASLHDILAALLNPAAGGVHGDAVYSQEALDRIITTLMESNPQSNAAPPASGAAIDNLERKNIDDEMLGPEGKAECTICIDSMHKGDEVLVLPCKHWFHGECVIMWLKEHNTCPICRTPIEGPSNNNNGAPPQPQPQTAPGPIPSMFASSNLAADRTRSDRSFRSPRENEERLNAIRNLGGYSTTSNRRSSMSPPAQSASDHPSRTRIRSPSSSRDRDRNPLRSREWGRYGAENDGQARDGNNARDDAGGNHGHGGYGPFGWLRDRFSGNSGGGSNNNRRQ